MGSETKIEWTDHTFNPWWGCVKVSPGCTHCYAETFAKRTGHGVWGPNAPRRFFGDKHWAEPLKWNAAAAAADVRRRVFCSSMADVFEDRRDLDAPRDRLAELIEETPELDWLLLTKRPDAAARFAPLMFPPRGERGNVWLGTTVEDQARADERIPALVRVRAALRFLSVEPILGPVDLRPWLALGCIGWVIVGGESGPGARPCDVAWILDVVRQCRTAGVPVFVKQLGSRPTTMGQEDFPAGVGWHDRDQRFILRDPKGGDPSEWPLDLRVREFPLGYAS